MATYHLSSPETIDNIMNFALLLEGHKTLVAASGIDNYTPHIFMRCFKPGNPLTVVDSLFDEKVTYNEKTGKYRFEAAPFEMSATISAKEEDMKLYAAAFKIESAKDLALVKWADWMFQCVRLKREAHRFTELVGQLTDETEIDLHKGRIGDSLTSNSYTCTEKELHNLALRDIMAGFLEENIIFETRKIKDYDSIWWFKKFDHIFCCEGLNIFEHSGGDWKWAINKMRARLTKEVILTRGGLLTKGGILTVVLYGKVKQRGGPFPDHIDLPRDEIWDILRTQFNAVMMGSKDLGDSKDFLVTGCMGHRPVDNATHEPTP